MCTPQLFKESQQCYFLSKYGLTQCKWIIEFFDTCLRFHTKVYILAKVKQSLSKKWVKTTVQIQQIQPKDTSLVKILPYFLTKLQFYLRKIEEKNKFKKNK